MKRLSTLGLVCLLALGLAACGEDRERQFSQEMESGLQGIEARLDQAIQAKNNIQANFNSVSGSAEQLRDDIASLRASIDQLQTTLNDLQMQINGLRTKQSEFKRVIEDGGSLLKYLIFIIIAVVVIYLLIKFFKQPKPFEEEEEEDFSAFDEDLGYEEGTEELGAEGPEEPKTDR